MRRALITQDESRYLLIGVFVPYVGRAVFDFLLTKVKNYCCSSFARGLYEINDGGGEHGSIVTLNTLDGNTVSFSETMKRNGLSYYDACIQLFFRLFFWHLMQPCMYGWVLYSYWDSLDIYQQIFGSIVGGREGLYVIFIMICMFYNPSFFICNVGQSNTLSAVIYVFCPEKTICMMMFDINRDGVDIFPMLLTGLSILLVCLGDLCAVAALIST
eukprot:UN01512